MEFDGRCCCKLPGYVETSGSTTRVLCVGDLLMSSVPQKMFLLEMFLKVEIPPSA